MLDLPRRLLLAFLVVLTALSMSACQTGNPQANSLAGNNLEEGSVPLQIAEGERGAVLPLVPVYIQDQGPFVFVLDTGASSSSIHQDLMDQLMLEEVDEVEVVGVTGREDVVLARVEQWSAGDVQLPSTTVTVIDMPQPEDGTGIQGLLGSDVLSQFGSITIDYDAAELILSPRE